jgi:hypothetical protein
MSGALWNSIAVSMGRSGLGGDGLGRTTDLVAVSFSARGTGARGASRRARSTARLRHPRHLQPQEEVMRRTSTMRVGAGGRHNSNGGAWRHVEVEVVAAGGIGRRAKIVASARGEVGYFFGGGVRPPGRPHHNITERAKRS